MSDAACGPSNSLQQFKQQTQVDRTLQQDRLTGRQHPAQGFRSADPNAGLLDPEFEAFQSGLPPPDFQSFQPHHAAPPPFQRAFQEPSQGPSWASDFQNMSLASPPPMQQQHHVGPSTSNWAQDFRSNVAQSAPRAQHSSPSPFAFQQRARYGMGGFQSNFAQPAYATASQSKGKEAVTEQFDEAAFERAFDMAREDMMVDERSASVAETATSLETSQMSQESHQLNQSDVLENQFDLHAPLDTHIVHSAEGNIVQDQKESNQSSREDDDALAATAQELLEKVEHNQSDKFRNSQFLGLMRKLRDREVKVEGDKMVETQTTSASTSTADLPLNSTSSRTANSERIPLHEQDLDANRHQPPVEDGADVVDLLSQPGLPGGSPSEPLSVAPEADSSNLNFTEDSERRRLSNMWRSMFPDPSPGPDRRTHSAAAEQSGLGGTAFTA